MDTDETKSDLIIEMVYVKPDPKVTEKIRQINNRSKRGRFLHRHKGKPRRQHALAVWPYS